MLDRASAHGRQTEGVSVLASVGFGVYVARMAAPPVASAATRQQVSERMSSAPDRSDDTRFWIVVTLLVLGMVVAFIGWQAVGITRAFEPPRPQTTAFSAGSDTVYFQCFRGLIDHATVSITDGSSSTKVDWDHEYAFHTGLAEGVWAQWRDDTLNVYADEPQAPPSPTLGVPVRLHEV